MGRAGAPVEKRRGVASSIGNQLLGRSKESRRMGVRDMASAIADLPFKAGVPGVECLSSILAEYVVRGTSKAHKERGVETHSGSEGYSNRMLPRL
jgi:hypothetical protein